MLGADGAEEELVRRIALALVLLGVGVVAWYGWQFARFPAGRPRPELVLPGPCAPQAAPPGPEDLGFDPASGLLYLSSTDRRQPGAPSDGLYVVDLGAAEPTARPAAVDPPADFHPHGLSIYRGQGVARLFAINHRSDGTHTVEAFDVADDGRLHHHETFRHAVLRSPNDLVAVGPRAFYATNDRAARGSGLWALLEVFFRRPTGSVAFVDGDSGRLVDEGIRFANGIQTDAAGSRVLVGEYMSQRIRVYDRDAESGDLRLRAHVPVDGGPDNIERMPGGGFTVALGLSLRDLVAHRGDPSHPVPFRVQLIPESLGAARTIAQGSGLEISAVSVAAAHGDLLVLGNIFDPSILVCREVDLQRR